MKTTFDQLSPGDRFRLNGKLWTKIGFATARHHAGNEHGRKKDAIQMHGQMIEVEYVPPK